MNKEFNKIVGKELMLLRKDCGFSNEELAKKSNIAKTTISRYENGYSNMNLDIIFKLVNACNMSLVSFFTKCIAKLQKEN